MNWLRKLIRGWLGVPSYKQARAIALEEIDADAVWADTSSRRQTFRSLRRKREEERDMAIYCGEREDTRYA